MFISEFILIVRNVLVIFILIFAAVLVFAKTFYNLSNSSVPFTKNIVKKEALYESNSLNTNSVIPSAGNSATMILPTPFIFESIALGN